jgi:hypothetical protein
MRMPTKTLGDLHLYPIVDQRHESDKCIIHCQNGILAIEK